MRFLRLMIFTGASVGNAVEKLTKSMLCTVIDHRLTKIGRRTPKRASTVSMLQNALHWQFASAEVNQKSHFQVKISTNGRPTKWSYAVECNLKSLALDFIAKCQIHGNKYCIQHPCGRHELILTVNGQEIVGSPSPVFVSIHPQGHFKVIV